MPTKKAKMFLCVTHKIIVLFSNKKLMILQKNTFWKRQILKLAETKLTNLRLAEWLLCATHVFFFAWARISCCELQIWNWVFSTKLSAREMLLQATFPVAKRCYEITPRRCQKRSHLTSLFRMDSKCCVFWKVEGWNVPKNTPDFNACTLIHFQKYDSRFERLYQLKAKHTFLQIQSSHSVF